MKFLVYNSQDVEAIWMTIDRWMDKDIHTVILVFSLKNKGNPSICNNTVEPGGHYAMWNNPGTERQILHYTTYLKNLKQLDS